jgi:glucose-6-phosphate dehydrogenase assembly protein OpcA
MSTKELIDSFIKGESVAAPVDAIEKELNALWQEAASKKLELTRACQFNLLVYSPHEGAYERAAHEIAELMRHHPGRALVVIAEPEADKNEISAYISASGLSSDNPICGEQITVIAKGNTTGQLPGIVTSLIVGNLPVVLWWQGDLPEENLLFEKLLAASQHLIFDSADGHDVGNTFSRARAFDLQGEKAICGDLNWLRLSRWRELMTEFIASQVDFKSDQVVDVNIEAVAAPEGDVHFAQPFLLLGWLANHLNWKLNEPLTAATAETGENIFRTSWQNEDKEVVGTIALRKVESDVDEITGPSGILSAQIRLQQNGYPVVFSVQRNFGQAQAAIRATKGGQTISESTTNFVQASIADLLTQEIDRSTNDKDYEGALRFATQLI